MSIVYQILLITTPIRSLFANTMKCFKQATICENREILLKEKLKKVKKIEDIDQEALTKEATDLKKFSTVIGVFSPIGTLETPTLFKLLNKFLVFCK